MLQEILNKTGLNWTVSKYPMYGVRETGQFVHFKTPYYGHFRDDTNECIGKSTDRYKVSQNAEVLGLICDYFGDNIDINNVEGGELKGGRRIYFTLKQENLFTGTVAETEQRLIIKSSHDGSSPIVFGFQDLVLVCTNGLIEWKDRGIGKVRIMHTNSMKEKLNQFDKLYSQYLNFNEAKKAKYTRWQNDKVTMDLALLAVGRLNKCDMSLKEEDFKAQFSPRKWNIVQAQLRCIEEEMNRQGETKWGLLNGFTNYSTHILGKKKTETERREALIDGGGYKINSKALKIVSAL